MSQNAEICRLLERAKPLRCLSADEAESAGLGKLVEEINALRKVQADAEREDALALIRSNLGTPVEMEEAEAVKRKPGRPRKAD